MLVPDIAEFLGCSTPTPWVEEALVNQEILLLDHKNNELKAASSALALIGRYGDDFELCNYMSKLAREELIHHEQVLRIIKRRNIRLRPVTASRYAGLLRSAVRKAEPHRLVDTLVVGAFIEARSCERFKSIAPHLDDELKQFYEGLLHSEARHYQHYLGFALRFAGEAEVNEAVGRFRGVEQDLITSRDEQFRFHSGDPRG
jgi:tRNA-(ms[2]io[6]A)-hydroxylase